jgi:hypothetical protein
MKHRKEAKLLVLKGFEPRRSTAKSSHLYLPRRANAFNCLAVAERFAAAALSAHCPRYLFDTRSGPGRFTHDPHRHRARPLQPAPMGHVSVRKPAQCPNGAPPAGRHDLRDGLATTKLGKLAVTARHPFPGGKRNGWANFVVGVMLSVGAFARLTTGESNPHAPGEDGMVQPAEAVRRATLASASTATLPKR